MSIGPLAAQEEEALNEKASRYHSLLLRRPDSGTLFERFVDSWLDTGSKEGLETFLKESAAAGGAPEWRLLATYKDWMGREEEALQAMTTALEKAPDDGTLLFARAKLKARLLNFEGALADLEKSEGAAGEEAATLKGTWLARAGRPEDALAAWKEVLEARPKDEELREDLVELQVGEGLYEEAIATGRELVEATKDPYQKALRLLRVAAVEVIAGKRDEGIATYRTVLAMTGEDSWLEKEVLAQVERVFQREENVVGLRKFYQELRESYPQRVSLRKGLAAQMAANGEIDEAVQLFREVLKITPGDVQNRRDFIALLEDAERYDLAVEELQVVLRDSNDPAAEWERMARLRDLMEDKDGLLQALEKVRELRAIDPPGVVATAGLYERYELRDETEAILREGRTTHPEANEVSEALASFLAAAESSEEQQAEATGIWLAMAEGADAEGLLRVARGLMAHQRAEPCFELLVSRIGEFPENVLLLKQICDAGLAADQSKNALPYAIKLARLAETATELTAGLEEVAKLARRLDLEAVISDFVEESEKSVADYCILSELRELQGDSLASDVALAEAAKLSDGPLVLIQRIRLLEKRGQIAKAIEAVREMIALPGGERPINLRQLVTLLASTGDIENALVETDNWKRIAPGDKSAWIRRAELLGELGELEQATDELRRAAAKFGDEEELKSLLAVALVQAGDYSEGQRIYRKLYEEADNAAAKSRWIEQLATLAKQENRVDELVQDFEQRARRNSREAAPLQALARVYEVLNNVDMQLETLSEAIRRKPDDLKLRLDLASVQERSGLYEPVLATLREAARLDSGSQAEQALAEFYFRNGEMESGLATLRGLQGGKPREVEATVFALLQTGEFEIAQNYLQETGLQDWRLQFLSALTLYLQDEKEEARTLLYPLAVVTDEIEGLSPMVTPLLLQQWSDYLQSQFPEEDLAQNARFNFMRQALYQYLNLAQAQHSRGSGYHSRGSSAAQPLPGTSAEMRALALSFLYQDASQQTTSARDKLLAAIPFPQDAFGLRMRNSFRDGQWYEEQLASGGMDLATVIRSAWAQPDLTPETLRRGYQELKDSDPKLAELALRALSRRDADDPDDALRLLQQRLALLEQLPSEEQNQILGQLAQSLLGNSGYPIHQGQRSPLQRGATATTILRDRLSEILAEAPLPAEGLEEDPDFVPVSQQKWFDGLLADAWLHGDAPRVVELANRKVADYLALTSSAPPGMINYHGTLYPRSAFHYRTGQSNTPLFPRPTLELPPQLLNLFQGRQQQNETPESPRTKAFRKKWLAHQQESRTESNLESAPLPKGMEQADMDAVVDQLDSPFLRILALTWSGNEEKLLRELAAFAESDDAEKVRWAAGYHFSNQDLPTTYQLLAKARFLPMDRAERQTVDLQLTHLGMQLIGSGTPLEDLEVARRAALRIRTSIADPNQQQAIQSAMTALGLGEVVARMQNARLRRGVIPSNQNSRRRSQTSPQFEQALSDGQKEDAAREALRLFKSKLRRNNWQYETRNLLETVQTSGLQDQILELAKTGDSHRQRMDFITLCSLFDKEDLIPPVVLAVLAEKPDDLVLAARFAHYLPSDEREKRVAPLMNAESLADFSSLIKELVFGQSLSVNIRTESEAKRLLEACRLTEQYLTAVAPDSTADRNLSWVLGLFNAAANGWYLGGVSYPALSEMPRNDGDAKELTLQAQRIERVQGLLRAALPHPQLAKQAFAILEGGSENYRPTGDELPGLALTAILAGESLEEEDIATNQSQNRNWAYRYTLGHNTSFMDQTWIGKEPKRYLITQTYQVDGEERVAHLDRLRKASPEAAATLELFNRFANGSDEESAEALAEWEKGCSDSPHEKESELLRILEISSLAGAPSSRIKDLELEYFRLLVETGFSYNSWNSLSSLLTTRYQSSGEDAYLSTLNRFVVEVIGPRELWAEWMELLSQNSLPAEAQGLASSLGQLNRYLLQNTTELGQLIALTSCEPILNGRGSDVRTATEMLLSSKTAAEQTEILENARFWSRPWTDLMRPHSNGNQNETIWSYVFRTAVKRNKTEGKALQKQLMEASGDDQFRKHLAALSIDGKDKRSADFLTELEEEAAILLTLPKDEQIAVATLLQQIDPKFPSLAKGDDTTKLFTTLIDYQRAGILAKARQRMADDFDKGLNHYQTREAVHREVNQILAFDPEFAATYYLAAMEDSRLKPATDGNQTLTMSQLYKGMISDLSSEGLSFMDWIRFDTALQAKEKVPPLAVGASYGYRIRDWGSGHVARRRNEAQASIGKDELLFPVFWEKLFADLPTDASPSLRKLYAHSMLLASADRDRLGKKGSEVWEWLSTSDYAEARPDLYRTALILLGIEAWDDIPEPGRAAAQNAFAETLRDTSLPPDKRLNLVAIADNREAALCDTPDGVEALTALFEAYADGGHPFDDVELAKCFDLVPQLTHPVPKARWQAILKRATDGYLQLSSNRRAGQSVAYATSILWAAIIAEDQHAIKMMLNFCRPQLRGDLGLMCRFATLGQAPLAKQLLVTPDLSYRAYQDLRWNAGMEEVLAALLPEIDNPGEQFRIECILKSRPEEGEASNEASTERLLPLIARFAKEAPKSSQARLQCLSVLVQTDETVVALLPQLEELAKRYNYSQSTSDEYMPAGLSADTLRPLLDRYFQFIITQGDLQPLDRHIENLAHSISSFRNNYHVRGRSRELLADVFDNLLEGLSANPEIAVTPETLQLSKDWYLDFAKAKNNDDKRLLQSVVALPFALHALAGQSKEFDQWVRTLPKAEQEIYHSTIKDSTVMMKNFLNSISGWRSTKNAPRRILLLTAFFDDHFAFETLYGARNGTLLAYKQDVISRTDYWDVSANVAPDHPYAWKIAFERANGRTRRPKDGYVSLQQMLQEAIDAEEALHEVQIRGALVNVLAGPQKDPAAAVAMFETIDWSRFSEEDKKTLGWIKFAGREARKKLAAKKETEANTKE